MRPFIRAAFGGIALLALAGCGDAYHEGPVSPHFDGERFFLPGDPRTTGFGDFLRWRFEGGGPDWPEWVDNRHADRPPARVEGADLRVSFVNHATVLLQTGGLNILTDPIWSERASPVSWAGPKRVRAPGVAFDDLPKIDVVLLSHNHYDHMDLPTIERVWRRDRPLILTPLGNDAILKRGIDGIAATPMDWGQTVEIGDGLTATLEPMRHWSRRGITDTNKALWGAFVVNGPGGPIYFMADTGYGDGRIFRAAAEKYGPFRFALFPIGAYKPEWFMEYAHMTPRDAVRAHLDSRACRSIATQHQTFNLADEGYEEPIRDLEAAKAELGVAPDAFLALENGQAVTVPPLAAGPDGKPACATIGS